MYPDIVFSHGGTRLVWREGASGSYRAWATALAVTVGAEPVATGSAKLPTEE